MMRPGWAERRRPKCMEAGRQLNKCKELHQVIVRPALESFDPVGISLTAVSISTGSCSWKRAGCSPAPCHPAGQYAVDHYGVEAAIGRTEQTIAPVAAGHYLMVQLGQAAGDELINFGIVLDE